jgi:hypothetical protein
MKRNMKNILSGFLAVVLIAAFCTPAVALDVKVTGKAVMAGYWESNRAMVENDETAQRYFTTFIQFDPVFQIADGLKLVTRFEGLERVAGLNSIGKESPWGRNSENEQNIAMKRGYISAKILGGVLDVGYMGAGRTGTDFMDYDADVFRIKYVYTTGPWKIQVLTEKAGENSLGPNGYSDADKDKYQITPSYKWSGGEVGTQFQWYRYNDKEQATSHPYKQNYYLLCPWFKATFGPVYVEGEINYYFGKAYDYNDPSTIEDKDYDSFNYYLMGKYTFGPAYVGAQIARVQGQDPTKADELNTPGAPSDQAHMVYQPTLVLWNDWTNRWTKQGFGTNGIIGNNNAYWVNNVQLYQIMAGYKPFDKLSFDVTFAVAVADEHPVGYVDDDYGNELDLYATYKLYDNLAYTIAFGYLWAGDYWKGTNANAQVGDDWLLMHKLTLTF